MGRYRQTPRRKLKKRNKKEREEETEKQTQKMIDRGKIKGTGKYGNIQDQTIPYME